MLAQDLSQTFALSSNTMSANGSIRADIYQDTDAAWSSFALNETELDVLNGAMTGGNIGQTASMTANSIATRDVLDAQGEIVTAGGDLTAAYITQYASDFKLTGDGNWNNELGLNGDENSSIDLGKISQIAMLSLNSVDIAGDITIGAAFDGDAGLLLQQGNVEDVNYWDGVFGNAIWAHASDGVSLGADADNTGVQAAYLNVNAVSAGGTLSGNVEQEIIADEYRVANDVDAYTYSGLADVSNMAQVAQVNLNDVSAAVFSGGDIDQHIGNGVEINIDNTLSAISDIGSVNIEGIVQQATVRVNSIIGL
jgi:hypothetical protein